jgi:uncharacterized protein DUF6498
MTEPARAAMPQPKAELKPQPWRVRVFRALGLLVTLAGNLVPLAGVLYWGWDTFQLLMLYWMETVIVAFWTIRRVAALPPTLLGTMTVNGRKRAATRAGLVGFFTLHAGIFISVHLLFLFGLFSGEWWEKVHGVRSFFDQLFISNGAWLALLMFFFAGWISFRLAPTPTLAPPSQQKTQGRNSKASPDDKPDAVGIVVGGLYVRIVVMQIAIIAGAWFAQAYGSMAPLLIVIGLKTLFDLGADSSDSFGKGMTFSSGDTTVGR